MMSQKIQIGQPLLFELKNNSVNILLLELSLIIQYHTSKFTTIVEMKFTAIHCMHDFIS